MSSFMEVYRRILLATNARTQSELAEVLEIRQSSISEAKRRGAVPSGWYIKLFEKFGLSQDWLRYGTGPMYLRTEAGYMPQEFLPEGVKENPVHYSEPAAKSTLITVYGMHCQFKGEGVPELEAVGKLALPSSFAGPDTLVLRMHSRNMSSTVREGAYLGVDISDTRPLSDGVFVLKDERAGLLVRRVFLDCGSEPRYHLRSDDKTHPESIMQPEEFSDRVVGRVGWVLQKV